MLDFKHSCYPDLGGKETDGILPLMLSHHTPFWFETLVMVGALAAFISTMDSQLLALSAMLSRDFTQRILGIKLSTKGQVLLGRVFVAVLAIIGLIIAFNPPDTILTIATQTFTGLAVLFPTTIAVLYWKKTTAFACILSITMGELLVVGFYLELIPEKWALGFLPVIPITLISTSVIIVTSLISLYIRNKEETQVGYTRVLETE